MDEGASVQAEVSREAVYYESSDGTTRIHASVWLPAGAAADQPRAIVQLVHGMAEYVGRYDDFARFLAASGYAVCGNDHIGHGESVKDPARLSLLPENGAAIMIDDVHELRRLFSQRFPADTPYFIFGHSMGSFIVRAYLARYGRGLTGAVVSGTGQTPIAVSRVAGFLARRIGARKGMDYRSAFLHALGDGSYAKKIPQARTDFDWLNTDSAQVDAYIADPACGVMFSVGGYASLTDLTAEVASKECASAVPAGLPVLFIAGAHDPVGACGSGVAAAARDMQRYSKAQVDVLMYENMRHEVLNEPDRLRVYDDVRDWAERQMRVGGSVGQSNPVGGEEA